MHPDPLPCPVCGAGPYEGCHNRRGPVRRHAARDELPQDTYTTHPGVWGRGRHLIPTERTTP